jgi:hypothetical protein
MFFRQQFRHLALRLLLQAQIFFKNLADGPKTDSMVSSKGLGAIPLVVGYGGSHRGDKSRWVNGFLWVEMVLFVSVFSGPCLLNNSVYL